MDFSCLKAYIKISNYRENGEWQHQRKHNYNSLSFKEEEFVVVIYTLEEDIEFGYSSFVENYYEW